MIIISASMPKSGSTLLCNYTEQLVAASAVPDAQRLFQDANNGKRFFARVSLVLALRTCWLSLRHGYVVIKTHSPPTFCLKLLIRLGLAKVTYIYRDPRDVALSAIDHGRRDDGRESTVYFRRFHDFASAVPIIKSYYDVYRQWGEFGQVHMLRYEDLMTAPVDALHEVCKYVQLPLDRVAIQGIVDRETGRREDSLNFNTGRVERHRTELSEDDVVLCDNHLTNVLKSMGYEQHVTTVG